MPNYRFRTSEHELYLDPASFDLVNRNRIYVIGEINTQLEMSFISNMDYLMEKNEKQIVADPIEIYINSPGGEVDAGLGMVDKIREAVSYGHTVRTVNCGVSASMASIILAAGSEGERYSIPNGRIMIHQPLGGASGQADDVLLAVEQLTAMHDLLAKITASFTHRRASDVKRIMSRDKWFTSRQAVDFGLVDKIGFPNNRKED